MENIRALRQRWLHSVLVVAAITVLAACDPPRDGGGGGFGGGSDADAVASQPAQQTFNATKLPQSGDVVMIGGWSGGNKSTATSEFYDPTTKKWTKLGSMATAVGGNAGALTDGTHVLSAGGFTGTSKFSHKTISTTMTGGVSNQLTILDLSTGIFTPPTSNMLGIPRVGATATVLNNNKILIAGGLDSNGNPVNTAEVFDIGSGTVSPVSGSGTTTMTDPRAFHTATFFGNGKVLLAGGAKDSAGTPSQTADIYDPGTDTFSRTVGDLQEGVGGHAAVAFSAGPLASQVVIFGGIVESSGNLIPTSHIEVYDHTAKTFSFSSASMKDQRAFLTATLLADNTSVLIAGGFANFSSTISTKTLESTFGSELNSAEVFDSTGPASTCVTGTKAGAFICNASMKFARGGHAATLLGGGNVLIAGGLGGPKTFSTSKPLNEAEVFSFSGDPATTGIFTKVGNMKAARGFAAAALMP